LLRLYAALLARFGPQRWWPGRTPYEISIGAVLIQHTAWVNAARAIAALRSRRLLAPERVAALPEEQLERVIRPAGTYRLKARRLLALTGWLLDRHRGKFDGMRKMDLPALRASLLAVPGLGPETADAILLYAVGRPVFVALTAIESFSTSVAGWPPTESWTTICVSESRCSRLTRAPVRAAIVSTTSGS